MAVAVTVAVVVGSVGSASSDFGGCSGCSGNGSCLSSHWLSIPRLTSEVDLRVVVTHKARLVLNDLAFGFGFGVRGSG